MSAWNPFKVRILNKWTRYGYLSRREFHGKNYYMVNYNFNNIHAELYQSNKIRFLTKFYTFSASWDIRGGFFLPTLYLSSHLIKALDNYKK